MDKEKCKSMSAIVREKVVEEKVVRWVAHEDIQAHILQDSDRTVFVPKDVGKSGW